MKNLTALCVFFFGLTSAQAACTAPWGAYIPEGSMITAFQMSNPGIGQSCQSQLRVCHSGMLSGYYTAQSCLEDLGCRGPYGEIANGASVVMYESDRAYKPETCKAQTRFCQHGNLSGYYSNVSCSQF